MTVAQCIERMLSLAVAPDRCRELQEKLASHTFNLAVVGEFKRGKSSLINALIGVELLPVGVVPLTSIITIVYYADAVSMEVVYEDGRRQAIAAEALAEYATEKGNPRNAKGVREILISHPAAWLKGGVRIVDTPGIGSVYEHNTEVAYEFLSKADAALFVLSADQPMTQSERAFLRRIGEYASRTFFVLNKADLLAENELQEVMDFCRGVLEETVGSRVHLFPVSARLALHAELQDSLEMRRNGLLPGFSDVLNRFFVEEKGKVLVASVARNALRLVSQAQFNDELEVKALAEPLDDLKKKIEAFERKKQEALLARNELSLLLDGEIKMLLKNTIESDLESFKAQLARSVAESVERQFVDRRELRAVRLREVLEQHAISEIRTAFDRWRSDEDRKASEAFGTLCRRLASRVDDMVDELFRYSSELFASPYDAVKAESSWQMESGLYYKFWSEPVSLQILASSAMLALPKAIAGRLLLRQARRQAMESVDTQAGRVRYDFAQRLEKSAGEFKRKILNRIDVTIEGIERAISKGVAMSNAGAVDLEERTRTLSGRARELEEIRRALMSASESTTGKWLSDIGQRSSSTR